MKEIQITLYDIFGYLIPGLVFTCSAVMAYWTAFENNDLVLSKLELPFWIIVLVVSYLAGHVAQSIANVVLRWKTNLDMCFGPGNDGIGKFFIDNAKKLTRETVDPSSNEQISNVAVLEVCDAMIEHRGSSALREIYISREGFYRGMFVSAFTLSIAFALRAFQERSVLKFDGFSHSFSWKEMAALAASAFLIGLLFFFRYRRFGKYLITHKVASALVLRHLDRDKSPPP